MKFHKFVTLSLICFLSLIALPFNAHAKKVVDNNTYYTNMNIWYEHPEKIYSTNYHKGNILPIGTAVKILKQSRKAITFGDINSNVEYRIVLVKDYTNLEKEAFFARYFSEQNFLNSGEYASLSSLEKKNIAEGTIEVGMSKKAVLRAYGYPPTHRTPTTDSDTWVFWTSRMMNYSISFSNGILTKILN